MIKPNFCISVKVFVNQDSPKPCFERQICQLESLTFDYNAVDKALRCLFGNNIVVQFENTLL